MCTYFFFGGRFKSGAARACWEESAKEYKVWYTHAKRQGQHCPAYLPCFYWSRTQGWENSWNYNDLHLTCIILLKFIFLGQMWWSMSAIPALQRLRMASIWLAYTVSFFFLLKRRSGARTQDLVQARENFSPDEQLQPISILFFYVYEHLPDCVSSTRV